MTRETKLAEGTLSGLESIVMGVSGTAPAFSLAATTAALVAAVGEYSPGSAFYCGLIMFGVTLSFMYLNRLSTSAGASYAWVSLVFGRKWGFFAGWSLMVASALFMVSGTIPLAMSTLALVAPELVNDTTWVSLVGAIWLIFVGVFVLKGIKSSSYLQVTLTLVEVGILLAIIVAALLHFIKQPTHRFPWMSFNPFNFTLDLFAKGALVSLFFYWGWDVTMNLSEESKDSSSSPGRAAFLSMIIVTLIFVAFLMCALIVLTDEEIKQSSANVLLGVAEKLFPKPWGNIAILAVIFSSLGTIETSILQFTRTLFAKSRDGVLHKRWAKVHGTWQTPWVATLLILGLGLLFLLLASHEPTVTGIIDISINVISFQVAFYYGLCGFACAWCNRQYFLKDLKKTVFLILWPILSATVLVAIDIYGSIYIFDNKSIAIGIGGIAVGIIPLWLNKRNQSSALSPPPRA